MLKLNLRRIALITSVRNLSIVKNVCASASVLAESKDSSIASEKSLENKKSRKNPTIAAVFASLKDAEVAALITPNIDEVILKAKTVNGLLNISDAHNEIIERKHALKIVSILAEWSSTQRANLADFENDTRFIKLCRMLGRPVKNNYVRTSTGVTSPKKKEPIPVSDLETVLSVKNDDEAAKLVGSITLNQMVKVIKNLGIKKRRSTPLLRSLAFNMSAKEEVLNLKECSDVLFAMKSLNFPEPILLTKLAEDIQIALKKSIITRSSAVGSVLTSLSLLRYRDTAVLDALTEWIVQNPSILRPQDIAALCISLASLNYMPATLENEIKTKLIASLTPLDFKSPLEYLTFVWSLLALNVANGAAFDSVLSQEFIDRLTSEYSNEIPIGAKIKLLNINGGVKLFMPSYKGAMLTRSAHENIYDVPLVYNQDKQLLCKAMTDALKSIVPEACLRTHVDTNMGFVIDAEFFIDEKSNPIPSATSNSRRVAMMVNHYYDTCQGGSNQCASGISALQSRLLTKAGYDVVSVHHSEFSVSDLLLKRVQYLQELLKSIN